MCTLLFIDNLMGNSKMATLSTEPIVSGSSLFTFISVHKCYTASKPNVACVTTILK